MLEIAAVALWPTEYAASNLQSEASIPAAVHGQEATVELPEVRVFGRRGSTSTRAEIEIGPGEIDALGADDIGQVVERIAQLANADERPTVIVNGRQIANPDIYFSFPPDALARAEVLPRSASSQYGDPNRLVVNIVLQERFSGYDLTLTGAGPTAGDRATVAGDLRQSSIQGLAARQLGASASGSSPLKAESRDVQTPLDPQTTLAPESVVASANAMAADVIGDWTANVSGQVQGQTSAFAKGREEELDVQRRHDQHVNVQMGLAGNLHDWSVRLSGNGRASSSTRVGLAPTASRSQSLSGAFAASKALAIVGAAPWSFSLEATGSISHTDSSTPSLSLTATTDQARVRTSLSVPLLARSNSDEEAGSGPGRPLLTLAFSQTAAYAYGEWAQGGSVAMAWTPLAKVRFGATWATTSQAPTEQQRYDPASVGAARIIYDFVTEQSVEVSPIVGGNPGLRNSRTDDFSTSLSVGPFGAWRVNGAIVLRQTDASGAISTLPIATPYLESVFPDRFGRGPDGALVSIDLRPLNLDMDRGRSMATNVSFLVPLRSFTGGRSPNVLRFGLDHRWTLARRTVLKPGLPRSDRLAGDDGGLPAHEITVLADGNFGDWTLNATVVRRSGHRVRRDIGADGPGDLLLDSYSAMNLRVGYTFSRTTAARRAAGLRVSFDVDNVLDSRPKARLATGVGAPGYGRDEQDALGRLVRVTVTRRF